MTVEETVERLAVAKTLRHRDDPYESAACDASGKPTGKLVWHRYAGEVRDNLEGLKPGDLLPGGNVVVKQVLLQAILDNDPSDTAADGVTCPDVWRKELCAMLAAAGENDEPG